MRDDFFCDLLHQLQTADAALLTRRHQVAVEARSVLLNQTISQKAEGRRGANMPDEHQGAMLSTSGLVWVFSKATQCDGVEFSLEKFPKCSVSSNESVHTHTHTHRPKVCLLSASS